MGKMTDPSDGMRSFQEAFDAGLLEIFPGRANPEVFVHMDLAGGERRWTYVRLEDDVVVAFCNVLLAEPIDGVPCFGIGYAVPPAFQNQGRAKGIVADAIAELRTGFGRNGLKEFYIEAVVGIDNVASQCVASAVISATPEEGIDKHSGLPIFQYILKVTT